MAQQSILIVEDDSNWQNIFSEIVTDSDFQAVIVATHQEALTVLANQTYALAIVDISLSELDHADRGGVEVLKAITNLSTKLPAIVVTGYATVDLAVETLVDLEAVHFFRKDKFNRREFARVVKQVATKPREPAPDIIWSEKESDILKALSQREREVLALLIQGWTNKQIAEALTITVNTVKKHVQSIFTKFNVDNRAAAVAKALKVER